MSGRRYILKRHRKIISKSTVKMKDIFPMPMTMNRRSSAESKLDLLSNI